MAFGVGAFKAGDTVRFRGGHSSVLYNGAVGVVLKARPDSLDDQILDIRFCYRLMKDVTANRVEAVDMDL